ncbi:MAG TPA: hypothetical protein DCP19_00470 [Pseudomonas sp.]|nr:hypothetical protein [Pseudomonas sp.]
MKEIVAEDQLDEVELRRFDDVLAVRSPDDTHGVGIFKAKRLPALQSPDLPAKLNENGLLLIVVDNPDDEDTVARLKAKCHAAWFGD